MCKKKTETCTLVNGSGEKTFNATTGAYGACTLKNCNPGFHKNGNSCESNTRACIPAIPNSKNATQTWNAATNTWDACQFECNTGYTKVGNVCKKEETEFQCPANLPRLDVTLPTDQATRSAWVEKVKGLKFLKAQTQDPHAGIAFLMSERQEGINNIATTVLFRDLPGVFCTDPNNFCDVVDVDTKQGVFPGVYPYTLLYHYKLDEDWMVYNPEVRAVEEYNKLICQWQALIPELTKTNKDNPTHLIIPQIQVTPLSAKTINHGIIDDDGITDVKYTLWIMSNDLNNRKKVTENTS